MLNIVDILNFSGRFFLSENKYNSEQLQDIINEYTKKFLVDLMGIELYNDFYNDFQSGNGSPVQDRWLKFLNGENYNPDGTTLDYIIEYKGIRSFLVPLIYAKIMRDPAFTSDLGYVDGNTDGAIRLNLLRTKNKADKAWNEGVELRLECVMYLYTNDEIYEDFELYYVKYSLMGTCRTETLR